jgi:predicted nucleotidyltransferase
MSRETWSPLTINVGTPYYIAPEEDGNDDLFENIYDLSLPDDDSIRPKFKDNILNQLVKLEKICFLKICEERMTKRLGEMSKSETKVPKTEES